MLCALVFLFERVLERPLKGLNLTRARRPRRLPVVLIQAEAEALLEKMQGLPGLGGFQRP